MPVGVIVNVLSVVLGGLLGSTIGHRLSDELKRDMTNVFGICAISMGIASVILMLLLFFASRLILPFTNDSMIADFRACGGIVLIATGFAIMKVKEIPVANMIPSMLLVMPVSALWMNVLLPLM